MKKYNLCSARIEEEYDSIPVDNNYIEAKLLQNVPYKWVNGGDEDETFFICYNHRWLEAQSIDFEF